MAHPDHSPRVGRSQSAVIFWGLVSLFFAAAFCYYFLKNRENESSANKWRDEALNLQDETDTLKSQKEKLQSDMSEAAAQLKTREDLVQEKETSLAAEETHLEAQGQPAQNQPQPGPTQAAMLKKFGDTARKFAKDDNSDVITRGGRPVLRISNALVFGLGETTLKPDGKALLNQVADCLNGQTDRFELRVESFTDSDAEVQKLAAKAATASDPESKSHDADSWDLTETRAAVIARFFRDQTSLPLQNVLVIARGDSEPITSDGKESRARNRRIEITVTPLAAPFHPTDTNPLAPPSGSPATADKKK